MSLADGSQGKLGEPSPDEFGDYQAISPLAVASVLVGAASATALVGVPLWIVPLVGILLSYLALMRINRSGGTLTGRPLAVVGLGLAVCFGTAALVAYITSQRLVAREARQVAIQWFQALAQGEPEVAHQWTVGSGERAGFVDPERLTTYYENDKQRHKELAQFVSQKPVATLLALGARAHAELESTTRIDDHLGIISQLYRVTADETGGPIRFLTELTLEHSNPRGQQEPRWTVHAWKFVGPEPAISAH